MLSVCDNLELYFHVQIFGEKRSSPYMKYEKERLEYCNENEEIVDSNFEKVQFIDEPIRPEKMLALYYEDAYESVSSDQLLPLVDSHSNHGDFGENTMKKMIFVLTDVNMYVVRNEFIRETIFGDAPVPVLYRLHPLETLRTCTIYFGFQRCSLHFHDMDVNVPSSVVPSVPVINWRKQGHKHAFGSPMKNRSVGTESALWHCSPRYESMTVFVYMILTKEKIKTHPIISKVLAAANDIRDSSSSSLQFRPQPRVEIQNKDSQFLDQVALLVHTHDMLRGKGGGGKRIAKTRNKSISINQAIERDSPTIGESPQHVEAIDVIHSQLLSQVWRKKPNYSEDRTLIITPLFFLLCKEDLEKQDVYLTLMDRVAIKDVHKLIEEENDRLAVTLVLSGSATNSSNKVTRSFATRKWRLRCSTRSQQEKVVEECRRICHEMGNLV